MHASDNQRVKSVNSFESAQGLGVALHDLVNRQSLLPIADRNSKKHNASDKQFAKHVS
jgi:hypothetical protein